MGRLWSLLYLLVPVLGVILFLMTALAESGPLARHWLPEDASAQGHVTDNLFLLVLFVTGTVFVATNLLLGWLMWKYDAALSQPNGVYPRGNHVPEIVWSVLLAATLLFLAIYQVNAWVATRMRYPEGEDGKPLLPLAEVTGCPHEWRIRYPGADGILRTSDDVFTVNDLHVPVNRHVVLAVKSAHAPHTLLIPNMRVRQDVEPGMTRYAWFRPVKQGRFDVLCNGRWGWSHYMVKGRLTVESRRRFDDFLDKLRTEQHRISSAHVVTKVERRPRWNQLAPRRSADSNASSPPPAHRNGVGGQREGEINSFLPSAK